MEKWAQGSHWTRFSSAFFSSESLLRTARMVSCSSSVRKLRSIMVVTGACCVLSWFLVWAQWLNRMTGSWSSSWHSKTFLWLPESSQSVSQLSDFSTIQIDHIDIVEKIIPASSFVSAAAVVLSHVWPSQKTNLYLKKKTTPENRLKSFQLKIM